MYANYEVINNVVVMVMVETLVNVKLDSQVEGKPYPKKYEEI